MCIDDGRVVSNFVAQVATSCRLLFWHLDAYAPHFLYIEMLLVELWFSGAEEGAFDCLW
jgi:hypothetical protein